MTKGFYKIPDHYKGDTFDEVIFTLKEDGNPVDLTGKGVEMTFTKNSVDGTVQEIFTLDKGLSLVDAVNGVYALNQFRNDWPSIIYFYKTTVIFSEDDHRTYLLGTLNVNLNG